MVWQFGAHIRDLVIRSWMQAVLFSADERSFRPTWPGTRFSILQCLLPASRMHEFSGGWPSADRHTLEQARSGASEAGTAVGNRPSPVWAALQCCRLVNLSSASHHARSRQASRAIMFAVDRRTSTVSDEIHNWLRPYWSVESGVPGPATCATARNTTKQNSRVSAWLIFGRAAKRTRSSQTSGRVLDLTSLLRHSTSVRPTSGVHSRVF